MLYDKRPHTRSKLVPTASHRCATPCVTGLTRIPGPPRAHVMRAVLLCLSLTLSLAVISQTDALAAMVTPVTVAASGTTASSTTASGTSTASTETIVKTAAELVAALENPAGSRVKLGANIRITTGRDEYGVWLEGGRHTLSLNGYSIEYSFINEANEYSGVPIRVNGMLTVNGPGTITGGYVALECSGWNSLLVINNANIVGRAASGLRSMGTTVINSGTLTGRFGDIWQEDGLIVDNAGIVDKIDYHFAKNRAIIRNNTLSGTAAIYHQLSFPNLTVPTGSKLTIKEGGILNITGTLTGAERVVTDGGLLVRQGDATVSTRMILQEDLSMRNLSVSSAGELVLMNGGRLTLSSNLTNAGTVRVDAGTTLTIGGNLVNSGTLHVSDENAFTCKGTITNTGTLFTPELDAAAHGTPFEPTPLMIESSNRLYALGVFQGTGSRPDGTPDFDLGTKPTRQVAITMLVRLLGKEQAARDGTWSHPFTDVAAWANPYVGYAYANGLTQGVSATRFGSDDIATPYQYLTFLLRALGYSDRNGDFSWSSPTTLTESLGLTTGTYTSNDGPFFRGDVAILSDRCMGLTLKGTTTTLLQQLVDLGAVSVDKVRQAGLEALLRQPAP